VTRSVEHDPAVHATWRDHTTVRNEGHVLEPMRHRACVMAGQGTGKKGRRTALNGSSRSPSSGCRWSRGVRRFEGISLAEQCTARVAAVVTEASLGYVVGSGNRNLRAET
jgi:hypothetical protein